MNTLTKTLLSIGAVLLAGAVGIMIYCFWPSVKGTIDESKYYSAEEAQEFYDKGYNDGCKSETELIGQVDYYKGIVDDYYIEVNTLNKEISNLRDSNLALETQVSNYGNIIVSNEETIRNLNNNVIEQQTLINTHEDTISSLNVQVSVLNTQVSQKLYIISDLENSINDLTSEKQDLEQQVSENIKTIENLEKEIEALESSNQEKDSDIEDLKKQISGYQNEIISKNSQITLLNNEITTLENQIANLQIEIKNLNQNIDILENQIINLKTTINSLNTTIETNNNTIDLLVDRNNSLQTQINNLNVQINNKNSSVDSLNKQILDLQESIKYYESYLASLENGTQVIATFEYDGKVINVQIVNKDSIVSVVVPEDTEYLIFNGWLVDGQNVDLSQYQLSESTRFVAALTYKYSVKFMVNDEIYTTQIVSKSLYATVPSAPTYSNQQFAGWSIDGINIVDVSSYKIESDTVFLAVFISSHTVNFMYEDTLLETQQVENGSLAVSPVVNDTEYKIFNGWTLDGEFVDLNYYEITENTTFVADIIYKYDVKFIIDEEVVDSKIIQNGYYASTDVIPTADEHYVFVGWSVDGTNIVDLTTYKIESETIFTPIFELEKFTVTFADSLVGGNVYGTKQVEYGSVIGELPFEQPTKEDYTFVKWAYGWMSTAVDLNTYVVTADIRVFSVFEQTTFTVSFYDGDTLLYSEKVDKGNYLIQSPEPLGRDGYNFTGWGTGSTRYTSETIKTVKITSNKTYNAYYILPYAGKFEGTSLYGTGTFEVLYNRNKIESLTTGTVSIFPDSSDRSIIIGDDGVPYVDISADDYTSTTDGVEIRITYTFRYDISKDAWIYNIHFEQLTGDNAGRTNDQTYEFTRVNYVGDVA